VRISNVGITDTIGISQHFYGVKNLRYVGISGRKTAKKPL